jgi:putative NIF3 family GTP cyclohydrolase 1 type 2
MDFNGFISDNFKKRYMGLLLDNSNEIKQVFSAVFPSDSILNKILELNSRNNLLFTHHPMVWDLTQERVFQDINASLLPKLKAMEISIYTLHVPLDKNGEYSTTVNLARKLEIDIEGEFYIYRGVKVGIYGRTKTTTPVELNLKLTNAVGHNTKLWKYGSDLIENQRVALIAGGGNEIDIIQEVMELGINTYVTGVVAINDYSKNTHEFEIENRFNLIGGTHYSTEKFACIALCEYFEKLGLNCEFIEGQPCMADLEVLI